jgi:uncharacterized protein
MSRGLVSILLLTGANILMTLAWYGHLRLGQTERFRNMSVMTIILISWGIAFFEYCLQVPANRIGFRENGGPFDLWQLKVIQEVITLSVFTAFTLIFFKEESLRMNHIIGFVLLIGAVYFLFRK